MSFLIPKILKKELKKLKNLKIEFLNEIDLSILDNEFFVEMLNNILNCKKSEVQNELPAN